MVAPIVFLRSRISAETSSRTAGICGSLFLTWRRANPLPVCHYYDTHAAPGNDAELLRRLAQPALRGYPDRTTFSASIDHVRTDPDPPAQLQPGRRDPGAGGGHARCRGRAGGP